ncbi:Dihydrodipicolinate synthase [Malassezia pachydermatis]
MPKVSDARKMHPGSQYSTLPESHPKSIEFVEYTPRTLALFDGSGTNEANPDNKILLAIDSQVFDVSSGRHFYGPSGPYGNFAGRDASRGMAKQSFDLEMITPLDQPLDTLEDLTMEERKNMNEWKAHFAGKYPIVGQLVNENERSS